MILIPAYGRDYTNVASLRQAWNDGKDFKILNGPYCSKDDFPKLIAMDGWVGGNQVRETPEIGPRRKGWEDSMRTVTGVRTKFCPGIQQEFGWLPPEWQAEMFGFAQVGRGATELLAIEELRRRLHSELGLNSTLLNGDGLYKLEMIPVKVSQ